jgi:hypothetical protein
LFNINFLYIFKLFWYDNIKNNFKKLKKLLYIMRHAIMRWRISRPGKKSEVEIGWSWFFIKNDWTVHVHQGEVVTRRQLRGCELAFSARISIFG